MKLLIIFLSLSLVSCKDEVIVERCIGNIQFQTCRCHPYKISMAQIGRVGEPVDKPVTYCDNRVSFSAEQWSNDILELIRGLYLKEKVRGEVVD